MFCSDVAKNIALYLGHTVLITLANGEEKKCSFFDFNGDTLEVYSVGNNGQEKEVINLTDVIDLRYVGEVTDYHTEDSSATIDNSYKFFILENEAQEKLLYKEFKCAVTCHLYFDFKEKKITASDVLFLDSMQIHYLPDVLLSKDFLYKYEGRWVKGVLAKNRGVFELNGYSNINGIPVEKVIEDITKFPCINDYVKVEWNGDNKEQKECEGVISYISDNDFCVVDFSKASCYVNRIKYEQMVTLRVRGIISTYLNGQGSIDDEYQVKTQYFLNEVGVNIKQGSAVTYIPGVNVDGLIAKKVIITNDLQSKVKSSASENKRITNNMPDSTTTKITVSEAEKREIQIIAYAQDLGGCGYFYYINKLQPEIWKKEAILSKVSEDMVEFEGTINADELKQKLCEVSFYAEITDGHVNGKTVLRILETAGENRFKLGQVDSLEFENRNVGRLYVNTSYKLGNNAIRNKDAVYYFPRKNVLSGTFMDTNKYLYDVLFWQSDENWDSCRKMVYVWVIQESEKVVVKSISTQKSGEYVLFNPLYDECGNVITEAPAPELVEGESVFYAKVRNRKLNKFDYIHKIYHAGIEEELEAEGLLGAKMYRVGLITGFKYLSEMGKYEIASLYINDSWCYHIKDKSTLSFLKSQLWKSLILYSADINDEIYVIDESKIIMPLKAIHAKYLPYRKNPYIYEKFEDNSSLMEKSISLKLNDQQETSFKHFCMGDLTNLAVYRDMKNIQKGTSMYVKTCRIPLKDGRLETVVVDMFYEHYETAARLSTDGEKVFAVYRKRSATKKPVFGVKDIDVSYDALAEIVYDTPEEQIDPNYYTNKFDAAGNPIKAKMVFYPKDNEEWILCAKILKKDNVIIAEKEEKILSTNPYKVFRAYVKEAEFEGKIEPLKEEKINKMVRELNDYPALRAYLAQNRENTNIKEIIKELSFILAEKYSDMKMFLTRPDKNIEDIKTLFEVFEKEFQAYFPFIVEERELKYLGILENIVCKYFYDKKNEENVCNQYARFAKWKAEAKGTLVEKLQGTDVYKAFDERMENAMASILANRTEPNLQVEFISDEMMVGQKYISFMVINKGSGETKCKDATNVNICITYGNDKKNLVPEKYRTVTVIKDFYENRLENGYVALLECPVELQNADEGAKPVFHITVTSDENIHISDAEKVITVKKPVHEKNSDIDNPYDTSKALEQDAMSDQADCPRMFYGREENQRTILKRLKQGEPLQPKQFIGLYGLKKSGKSSMINCLIKDHTICFDNQYLKSMVISLSTESFNLQNANDFEQDMLKGIIKKLGVIIRLEIKAMCDTLKKWVKSGYSSMKMDEDQSYFEKLEAVKEFLNSNIHVEQKLKYDSYSKEDQELLVKYACEYLSSLNENDALYVLNPCEVNKRIQWSEFLSCENGSFNDFMNALVEFNANKFSDLEKTVSFLRNRWDESLFVVILDEFTYFAGKSTRKFEDFAFLNHWKDAGISFILIGHERMYIKLMAVGGSNNLISKNQMIQLGELDEPSAKQLIKNPFKTIFGQDSVYQDGIFGDQVVDRILKYSGNNANYITALCRKVFELYSGIENQFITANDVEAIADSFFNGANYDKLVNEFDPLLDENQKVDDGVAERVTEFLYRLANSNREHKLCYLADYMELNYFENAKEYSVEEPGVSEKNILDLLDDRKIISITPAGTWNIKVGLLEKILRKPEFNITTFINKVNAKKKLIRE